MTSFVVDASVAAKWYLREDYTDLALHLLEPGRQLHAPDFLLLEMDNLLCKHARRGRITVVDAGDIRAAFRRCGIRYSPFGQFLDRAYDMASRTGCSVYDCLYAALAEALGGRMVTADRRFYGRMAKSPFADYVLWVEDVGRAEAKARRRDTKGRRRKRE